MECSSRVSFNAHGCFVTNASRCRRERMACIARPRFLRPACPAHHHLGTMAKFRIALPLAVALLCAPGGTLFAQTRDTTLTGFPALASDFVFTSLAFSPASATQAGLHDWTDPY